MGKTTTNFDFLKSHLDDTTLALLITDNDGHIFNKCLACADNPDRNKSIGCNGNCFYNVLVYLKSARKDDDKCIF